MKNPVKKDEKKKRKIKKKKKILCEKSFLFLYFIILDNKIIYAF